MKLSLVEHVRKEFEIRVFSESFPRIQKCLSMIDERDVWHTPNELIPSIGNQIQHIIGNARQWVCSGIGGVEDNRNRDAEFTNNDLTIHNLSNELVQLENDLSATLSHLNEEMLQQSYSIQGIHSSGFSVMIHVIEHVSYHTGQITLLTKLLSGRKTGYYDGFDLNGNNQVLKE